MTEVLTFFVLEFPLSRPAVVPGVDVVDERILLSRVKAGDREAAEALVSRTYAGVFAALCRMTGGDRDLAADLSQETYRKAWEALPGFDGRAQLSTWLFRISYNTFLNHVRRPHRIVPLDEAQASAAVDPELSSEERLSEKDEAARLRRAVLELPEELRYVVTAFFWAEVPVREIARQVGVTTVAIRKRLKRAYSRLGEAVA
ncbi:MAG: sigma-70 family RNA polymerase sigma factor [Thermoanaerobaculia bacterium]